MFSLQNLFGFPLLDFPSDLLMAPRLLPVVVFGFRSENMLGFSLLRRFAQYFPLLRCAVVLDDMPGSVSDS